MNPAKDWQGACVYTLGHSTHTLDELRALLQAFGISVLADIRTLPRSRRNPQFNRDTLPVALRRWGIHYVHLPRLGGLRRARKDSANTAWRNESFRGFADYMLTADFEAGLEELHALLGQGRVALMCAEAVPWRCHRSLIADVLTTRGARVEHISALSRPTPHRLTSFAEVRGVHVTYPAQTSDGERLDTRAPFHFEATVRVLQRRPVNRIDRWEHNRYLRVLGPPGELALVEVENHGTIDAPDLRYTLHQGNPSSATAARLAQILRRVLGLDVDPLPLQQLAQADRMLRPTALALRGMRPPRFAEWFETFAKVIPFQQVSLDAGVAIVGRLVERFGTPLEYEGRRYHAFPTAEAVAEARPEALRACGLSLRKAEALCAIARAIDAGELSEEKISALSTPEALRVLVEQPGIGPWSANVALLRGLGRLDVFPPGDVGAMRGLRTLLRLPPEAPLAPVVERFGTQRGYLYFYVLGSSLLTKGLIHSAPAR